MNKKSFGLDIGATNIKAVELEHKKEGIFLSASITSPTPPKGMMSESPIDEEEMAEAIKKTVQDAGISSKKVNVALPENQVYTKLVEMPYLSDKELASAIYWEAEQHIPIPLSSVTLSWSVVKKPIKPKPNDKMSVLMVGAPSLIIKKYQKIISMAGLGIQVMETEILSTTRSVTFGGQLTPTIIVSIGAVSTSIAIVSGSLLIFTYSIPIGGSAINRAISTDFGVSHSQAEEYKRTYGISQGPLGQKIGKATMPILTSVLTEVKKASVFYSQRYKESKIEQIILSGGTSKLPGIVDFFASYSGIKTLVVNPWSVLSNQDMPQEILNEGPNYSIAVGLSLKNYEH